MKKNFGKRDGSSLRFRLVVRWERKEEREREKKILFSSARYYYHVSASGIQLKGGTVSSVFESEGGREEGIKEGA